VLALESFANNEVPLLLSRRYDYCTAALGIAALDGCIYRNALKLKISYIRLTTVV
jgi:hypothetical protein